MFADMFVVCVWLIALGTAVTFVTFGAVASAPTKKLVIVVLMLFEVSFAK